MPPLSPLVKKFFLRYDLSLRMMRDKDDFDMLIFRPQEAGHPEEKAAGDIFFEGPHTAGSIHHRKNQSVRLRGNNFLPRAKPQVVRTDAMNPGGAIAGISPQVLQDGALFIDIGHDAFLAYIVKNNFLADDVFLFFFAPGSEAPARRTASSAVLPSELRHRSSLLRAGRLRLLLCRVLERLAGLRRERLRPGCHLSLGRHVYSCCNCNENDIRPDCGWAP